MVVVVVVVVLLLVVVGVVAVVVVVLVVVVVVVVVVVLVVVVVVVAVLVVILVVVVVVVVVVFNKSAFFVSRFLMCILHYVNSVIYHYTFSRFFDTFLERQICFLSVLVSDKYYLSDKRCSILYTFMPDRCVTF